MNKHALSIVGIVIQLFGIGLMLYGITRNPVITWIGFPIIFIGLAIVIIGLKKANIDKSTYDRALVRNYTTGVRKSLEAD